MQIDLNMEDKWRAEHSKLTKRQKSYTTLEKRPSESGDLQHDTKVKSHAGSEKRSQSVLNDPVNHPSHYTSGRIEVIDFITDQNLGFCLGNVIKYVSRAGKKLGKDDDKLSKEIEDLEKARFYLNHRIRMLKCLKQNKNKKEQES